MTSPSSSTVSRTSRHAASEQAPPGTPLLVPSSTRCCSESRATTYVRELAGLEPRRDGKVHCPFHHDETPSLQLYDDGTWCCFAQHGTEGRIGGSIYDFGGRLWCLDTKGRGFLELRHRLAETLLTAYASEPQSCPPDIVAAPPEQLQDSRKDPRCPASETPR